MKDKEQTKRKLIDAVADIFRTEGYAGLGVNKVAKIAGVHKKLIYRYFGGFEQLVEAYVVETDYWMQFADNMRQLTLPKNLDETKNLISHLLKNQFLYFQADEKMQQLILWELSTNSNLMRGIYYTILHTRHNGGMFSDVNLATESGQQDILDAIDQILNLLFENVSYTE
jgi:AcrR family transcriptional regulator